MIKDPIEQIAKIMDSPLVPASRLSPIINPTQDAKSVTRTAAIIFKAFTKQHSHLIDKFNAISDRCNGFIRDRVVHFKSDINGFVAVKG